MRRSKDQYVLLLLFEPGGEWERGKGCQFREIVERSQDRIRILSSPTLSTLTIKRVFGPDIIWIGMGCCNIWIGMVDFVNNMSRRECGTRGLGCVWCICAGWEEHTSCFRCTLATTQWVPWVVGSLVGIVGIVGSLVGSTCGEDQRDAVPGSIHKLWVTLGYQLLGWEFAAFSIFVNLDLKFSAKSV